MTSSAQFKTWLDANTLYQSRQRAWAGRLYNPRVTAWYPDQRPAGSLSQSYRSREKSPYEPFQGFYHHSEILLAERRQRLVDGHEEDFRAARRNNLGGRSHPWAWRPAALLFETQNTTTHRHATRTIVAASSCAALPAS